MKEVRFKAKEVIISEGAAEATAYLVKEGVVEVYKETEEGEKILLTSVKKGSMVGEMSLIDEKPRSATVVAGTDVVLFEFDREYFYTKMISKPELLKPLLGTFFERLRLTSQKLAFYKDHYDKAHHKGGSGEKVEPGVIKKFILHIEPKTKEAAKSLFGNQVKAEEFPYLIGRVSDDLTADIEKNNDLNFFDRPPYNISRNHCQIEVEENGIYLWDRGSEKGSVINGEQIGGPTNNSRMELKKGDNDVIMGDETSPYKFNFFINIKEIKE